MNHQKTPAAVLFVLILVLCDDVSMLFSQAKDNTIHMRANQVGYLPEDDKIALAFSHQAFSNAQFEVIDAVSGTRVWGPQKVGNNAGAYGNFAHHYRLDFTALRQTGRFKLRIAGATYESLPFNIGPEAYAHHHELLLAYMRQQRCGYNPFLDEVCHQKDGRSMYGPMPDSTYLDASGGWLRDRFTEIGVIQFEDWTDTGEEYDDFALGKELA